MIEDYSPRETIVDGVKYWWLLAILMIAGGLLGLLFHMLRPPLYEATATFALGIDYTRTGPMSQYDEDMTLGLAGSLIYSYQSMQETVDQAIAQGIQVTPDELKANSSIERKMQVWILRVRDPNPETAAILANLWAENAVKDLKEAYQHALVKESLERYAVSLETCLENSVATDPISAECNPSTFSQVQADLKEVQNQIAVEKDAARNIFPGLLFEESEKAFIPTKPVLYGRSYAVLAGALIGFLLGVVVIQTGPDKWLRRKKP